MKLAIAGEGPNELGDLHRHPAYREGHIGVLTALVHRFIPDVELLGLTWKRISKTEPGAFRSRETRNVLGACLFALENGCDGLVFTRDRDRDTERERQIRAAIEQARQDDSFRQLRIVGGCAVEMLESWILSMLGQAGSERERRPKERLEELSVRTTAEMVEVIEDFVLEDLPADAKSLLDWIEQLSLFAAPDTA